MKRRVNEVPAVKRGVNEVPAVKRITVMFQVQPKFLALLRIAQLNNTNEITGQTRTQSTGLI
jgi:hypothetical protein